MSYIGIIVGFGLIVLGVSIFMNSFTTTDHFAGIFGIIFGTLTVLSGLECTRKTGDK